MDDGEFEFVYHYNKQLLDEVEHDIMNNRIHNKILDRDWFSAHLFVTLSARDYVRVRLQVSDLNFLKSDTCNWINGFLSNVFYSFRNLG